MISKFVIYIYTRKEWTYLMRWEIQKSMHEREAAYNNSQIQAAVYEDCTNCLMQDNPPFQHLHSSIPIHIFLEFHPLLGLPPEWEKRQCGCCNQQITQQHRVQRPRGNEALRLHYYEYGVNVRQEHEECYHQGAEQARLLRGYDAVVYVFWCDQDEMILDWLPGKLCFLWGAFGCDDQRWWWSVSSVT